MTRIVTRSNKVEEAGTIVIKGGRRSEDGKGSGRESVGRSVLVLRSVRANLLRAVHHNLVLLRAATAHLESFMNASCLLSII